ncbi:MAG: biopolymer transporter ExbD [Planctomycetota bacterium]|nr:biopolymer transporter ExbD [Planctomycetota bacterium]
MKMRLPPKKTMIQPPIIPVIDVVFNLLIFFLLMPSTNVGQGFLTTNLPTSSGPVAGKPTITEIRLRITLEDVGPDGVYVDNAKNEFCAIKVEGKELGGDFGALQAYLEQKRAAGLAATTPILLAPTMPTLHEWVVRAFDAAVAARFTNVQFAVPYE